MKASKAVAPVSSDAVKMTSGKFVTLMAEINALERYAQRAAIVASDNTSMLLSHVEDALLQGQATKELMEEIRVRLEAQNHALSIAMSVTNLSVRLSAGGDLAAEKA